MRNDVFTDTDALLLQQLFETGSLAPPEDDTPNLSPPGGTGLRNLLATVFFRTLADRPA